MAKAPDLEQNITGFYVKVQSSTDDSTSLALVDGLRMGCPYSLPDIKFYTKHLLLSQPPFPKITARITKISDDPITKDDIERWEASLAILQLSASHKLDLQEAKRRKNQLIDSIETPKNTPQNGQQDRAGSASNLNLSLAKISSNSKQNDAEANLMLESQPQDSTAPFSSSINLFESFSSPKNLVSEDVESSPKKKYDISKFLPAPADKPPEIIKSTPTGVYRPELELGTSVKVSMLKNAFESSTPESVDTKPTRNFKVTKRKNKEIEVKPIKNDETKKTLVSDSTPKYPINDPSVTKDSVASSIPTKDSVPSSILTEDPVIDSTIPTPSSTKDLVTKPSKKEEKIETKVEATPKEIEEKFVSDINDNSSVKESPKELVEQDIPEPAKKSTKDTVAEETSQSGDKLRNSDSSVPPSETNVKTNVSSEPKKAGSSDSVALGPKKSSSGDNIALRPKKLGSGDNVSSKKKKRKSLRRSKGPTSDSSSFVEVVEDVALRFSPKKRKKLKKKRNEGKLRANTAFERPAILGNDKDSLLNSLTLVNDESGDSFLDDDKKKKKKRKKNSTKGVSCDSVSTKSKGGSSDDVATAKQTGSSDAVTGNNSKETSRDRSQSGHKRHLSSEDVSETKNIISPRNINLNMPHVLSQIVIPVCSLPGSQEWEIRKIRNFEKLAKQRVKEKAALDVEIQTAKNKLEQDTQNHTTAIAIKQQQERTAFQKKIMQDKTTLSELQIQEKRALDKSLLKEKEQAHIKLTQEHDVKDKLRIDEFEKQVSLVKKANRTAAGEETELLDHLKSAHDACMSRESHKRVLNQLQMFHKHAYEKLKKRQELEKKHVAAIQQLERDVLIQQLSLSQKQLRQRRWVILDDIRNRENVHRQLQERRHQMAMRHENSGQDTALKLLNKQQQMERDYIGKNIQTHHKQGNLHHQKQKKTLKTNFQQTSKKIQRDKTLSKEDAKAKLEQLKAEHEEQVSQLEEQLVSAQSTDIQDHALQVRHEEQMEKFKIERKRRRDVLLLYHQKEKNILQGKLDDDRKQIEQKMKENVEAFHAEEEQMKQAFTQANESNLWALQERHWLESGDLQKANHEEQQNFIANIQSELETKITPRAKPKPTANEDPSEEGGKEEEDDFDEAELQRQHDEIQREQQELQEQLERQLEEQQEAEKQQLEAERAKEQEKLTQQLEEEKKEVMETKIEEDEDSLRLEYIRKIANDTGLSEEMIAKQLDRIGMPSFMF